MRGRTPCRERSSSTVALSQRESYGSASRAPSRSARASALREASACPRDTSKRNSTESTRSDTSPSAPGRPGTTAASTAPDLSSDKHEPLERNDTSSATRGQRRRKSQKSRSNITLPRKGELATATRKREAPAALDRPPSPQMRRISSTPSRTSEARRSTCAPRAVGRRRRPVGSNSTMLSLCSMSWTDFETVCGEIYSSCAAAL